MRPASARLGCEQASTSYAAHAPLRPCLRAAGPASAPQRGQSVATQAFVGGQAAQAGGVGLTECVWALSLGAAAIWLGKSLFEQVSPHPPGPAPRLPAAVHGSGQRLVAACLPLRLKDCASTLPACSAQRLRAAAGQAGARGAAVSLLQRHRQGGLHLPALVRW